MSSGKRNLLSLHHLCIFIASLREAYSTTPLPLESETTRQPMCFHGPSAWYRGTHNNTVSGIPCQRWDSNTPHMPIHKITDHDGRHNYCRNPDGDLDGLWCHTLDPRKRWDYCNLPKCSDDSIVVWTNLDTKKHRSHLVWTFADPEVVKDNTNNKGLFNLSIMLFQNQSTETEFWSLAGNYKKNLLFFSDYRAEYLGIRHLETNKTDKMFEGMAHGIESLAYDWVTENLYWTDSEFRWIMVVDPTFQHYTPIHKSEDPIYGLALHAKQRKLFFSTYHETRTKIKLTDLAGKGERILFQFPRVFDVTGLTIDYSDDRLYWTDFNGFASMVMSSNLDGTNLTAHNLRMKSIYWSIAAYMEHLYVTDVYERGTSEQQSLSAGTYYTVWIIAKSSNSVFRYNLPGKPRGITVLNKYEERSFDKVNSTSECQSKKLPTCEHICLPRINATRECECSLGYQLVDGYKCQAKVFPDEFMVVADSGQGRLFQIPFNYSEENVYSVILPTHKGEKITTIAVDTNSKYLYWSDKRHSDIKKSSVAGKRIANMTISNATHASYIIVDPCTNNIFFIDSLTQSIKVMSSDGAYVKTILQTNLTSGKNTSIQMITQDLSASKIYWTNTRRQKGMGQVWRMNLDGSGQELVYDKLHWPRAITVDDSRRSLFISEALTAMVYEVSLSSLNTIDNTSTQSIKMQYDLAGALPRPRFHILEIKVHNDILYFIDGKHTRIEKFNLTLGPSSLSPFGPAAFFSVTSMSVFSENSQTQNFDCAISSCTGSKSSDCEQICVAKPGGDRACLCDDGYKLSGSLPKKCYKRSAKNNAPDHGDSCPSDLEFQLGECAESVDVEDQWKVPMWKDDQTPANDLIISRTPKSLKLPEGRHPVTYTAEDWHGASGECTFTVTVKVIKCGAFPMLPSNLTKIPPSCGNQFGSSFHISCRKADEVMILEEKKEHYVTVLCSNDGQWLPLINFVNVTCEVVPLPTKGDDALRTGTLIAISFLVFGFVVVVCFIIIIIRNRPIWKMFKLRIPKFWRADADENKEISDTISVPYAKMT